eukprot:Blabericola_migrator_1__3694@NODE_2104_length_3268_cov_25_274289_g1333_i0_p3_GENE_NODE_2104_length_3268_cov_25_274289_g1333_i0NODE_2104_length_3268_cov_25_274289_g1333_i0_p3_ORF_typecomplete_len114_score23_05_NODE_2104_length_3268_cov_25_274289_g1333_i014471788
MDVLTTLTNPSRRKTSKLILDRLHKTDDKVSTLPGTVYWLVPKAHFIDYQKQWPDDACFMNSCLFVEWPDDKMLELLRSAVIEPEAIDDHLVAAYGAALCPSLFENLPVDYSL